MVNSLKPINVTPESDWARILDDALDEPVLLEWRGVAFQLTRQDADHDIRYVPDEELVHRTLDAVAGSWADLDVDQVIKDVYAARETGSRTADLT